jgi:oligoendopeptidase F
MSFNTDIIDKIVSYKTVSKREKISRLLELESNYLANNISCDLTKTEKNIIRKNSRYIYRAISKINSEVGNKFLQFQDKDA